MNATSEHATYDDRLYSKFMRGGPSAVEAVLTLMERNDPLTFEQARAMDLVHGPVGQRTGEIDAGYFRADDRGQFFDADGLKRLFFA